MTKKKPGVKTGRPARHGGYSLLTRGVLPEKRKYVGHYLTAIREGLIRDLAGKEEDLTTAQRILIDRVVTFLGVVRLIEEHAREHGILDAKGELTSGLTVHYLSFNRHIKDCLALLGIDRRQVEAEPSLADIIAEHDAAAASPGEPAAEVETRPADPPAAKPEGVPDIAQDDDLEALSTTELEAQVAALEREVAELEEK